MIPKGWEIKQFSSLVKHLKPGTNYQPDRVEDGIPFVNGKHIQDGFLDLTDIKYITQDEYDRVHKSWQPEAYDVLITRIGTLGKVGVIMPSDLPLALHYNSIDIKAGKLNHQFLYFLLKSDFFQKQFHTNKKQAVQEFITIEAVEQLKILMPNSEKIFEILSGIFDSYFNLIEINTNHIRTLEKTRDTLLPKLLSGEIDVSELEIK
jgi:type I restriction enzyme S subunit